LAKKGIWVSEFRIESGLNCGGHAFPTEGNLLGPILEEFKNKISDLKVEMHEIYKNALTNKNKFTPNMPLNIKVTVQGGVGTNEEHEFLLSHYRVDSVGWGTPFLLVPEVVNIDDETLNKLIDSEEDDLYLSNISPLGVQFNSLKGNTKDVEKHRLIDINKPGSNCPKQYVSMNYEFSEKGLCTASRQYQYLKIKELKAKELPEKEYNKEYSKIVDKSCICVGLGTSALLVNGLDTKVEGDGVSICPGPNMAYFNSKMTLKEIVDHIYGRINVIKRDDRPNFFIKELQLYMDYLSKKFEESKESLNLQEIKYFKNFATNLENGINYYNNLFDEIKNVFEESRNNIFKELNNCKEKLNSLTEEIFNFTVS